MSFVKFLIERFKAKAKDNHCSHSPFDAMTVCEGTYYSTLTIINPPYVEIDWDELQVEIEKLELEFKSLQEPK